MRNVMTRAWEIAKEGQMNFGGKASEYLSEALRIAWAESSVAVITTTEGSRNNKSWVAKLTAKDSRWGFVREFVQDIKDDYRNKTFKLGNGFYEVCDAGYRSYIEVVNGNIEYLDKHEVLAA